MYFCTSLEDTLYSTSLEDTVQMTPVVMPEESVSVHASVDSPKPAYTVKIGQ